MAGTHQEQRREPWKKAAHWLALRLMLSYLFHTPHLPRDGATHNWPGLLHPLATNARQTLTLAT